MSAIPETYRELPSFSFGDTPEMADSGARDVINGKQVATCGSLEILSRIPEKMPHEGMLETVLDGKGKPACVIRTHNVDTVRYDEIDGAFALQEACVDLDEWQSIHEAYFRRLGVFAPEMKLVRQFFEVIDVLERPAQ